jgi:hypothetical protein
MVSPTTPSFSGATSGGAFADRLIFYYMFYACSKTYVDDVMNIVRRSATAPPEVAPEISVREGRGRRGNHRVPY